MKHNRIPHPFKWLEFNEPYVVS